jgi:hypothetical protein
MNKSHASRSLRVLVLAVAALAVSAVAFASTAAAEPKGIFKIFNDCPTTTPGVALCSYAKTTSGEFSIGSTKVPITSPIILQGGAIPTGNPENEREYFLVPAKDGNSLSKTELNVPGGLTNLVNCTEIKGNGLWEVIERGSCKAIFENGLTGVTLVTEIAASATNPPILDLVALSTEEGTALTLPTKVHLKNPLLGESCYIGSEKSPVQLHLTTGTSGTLTGKRGKVENKSEFGQFLLRISENTLVDNTYTAPVAEGCGGFFSFLIDPIVNSKLGLPSKAGANKAVLNGELNSATVEAVKAAE